MRIVVLLIVLFSGLQLQAYSEFISLGYSRCTDCHNNPTGGTLSPQGREIWKAYISRPLLSAEDNTPNAHSEHISSDSSRWWMRGHASYRGQYRRRNPGSDEDQVQWSHEKLMLGLHGQNEVFNQPVFFSISAIHKPLAEEKHSNQIERFLIGEFYIRTPIQENTQLYIGLLPIVFGNEILDSSSFYKNHFSLKSNQRTESVLVHFQNHNQGISLQAFQGDPDFDSQFRKKGFSAKWEQEVHRHTQAGISFYQDKNDYQKTQIISVHARAALNFGSSLHFEHGWGTEAPQIDRNIHSNYSTLQAMSLLQRGNYVRSWVERQHLPTLISNLESWRWGIGFLSLPTEFLEFRADVYQTKILSPIRTSRDEWTLQGQIHVNL